MHNAHEFGIYFQYRNEFAFIPLSLRSLLRISAYIYNISPTYRLLRCGSNSISATAAGMARVSPHLWILDCVGGREEDGESVGWCKRKGKEIKTPFRLETLPSRKTHSVRWWFLFLFSTLGFVHAFPFREPDKIRNFSLFFLRLAAVFLHFTLFSRPLSGAFCYCWCCCCVCALCSGKVVPCSLPLMHAANILPFDGMGSLFEVKSEKKLKTSQVLNTTHCSRCYFIWNSSQPTKKLECATACCCRASVSGTHDFIGK